MINDPLAMDALGVFRNNQPQFKAFVDRHLLAGLS